MDSDLLLDKTIDLVVTTLGVAFGSFTAFYIAKFQLNEQSRQEKKKNDEITATLLNRCRLELRENKQTIQHQLLPTLERSNKPHESHYEWILTIAESFQRAAYDDLLRLNLSHNMPKMIAESLSISFEILENLKYMIKKSLAGFKYQNVFGGTPDSRQTSYDNIKTYSATVFSQLDSALKEVDEYTKKIV